VAALRVVLVSYPVALAILLVISLVVGGEMSHGAILWGGLCGLSQAFGIWWFYAALGSGPISVVSPLTAILVAAIPVGVGLALGERPGPIAGVGAVLALVAVVLVSREITDKDVTPHHFTTKVAWLTVGAGVAFGLNFVLIAQAPPEANLWPLVFSRLAASGNLAAPSGTPLRLAYLAALLDVGANITMLLALHASLLSLAGVLMSLYPAATVLLAILVLRERVTRWQALGMVLAMAAVAMIAAG
jgi:drug/metabolite transporter (DMT)-like permease